MLCLPLQLCVSTWATDRQLIPPGDAFIWGFFFFSVVGPLFFLAAPHHPTRSTQMANSKANLHTACRFTPGLEYSRLAACCCMGRRVVARQPWQTRLRTSVVYPSSELQRQRSCLACQVCLLPPPPHPLLMVSCSSVSACQASAWRLGMMARQVSTPRSSQAMTI